MANTYYVHSSVLVPGTKARAEDVNSRCDGIEDGFDKLPAAHANAPGTKGFSEAFKVVDATAVDHPASAKQVRDGSLMYSLDTGTANAYIATLPIVPTGYVAGMEIKLKAANTNSGASTINVNGLGLKNIKTVTGSALGGGEIVVGRVVGLRYDGTDFIVLDGMMTIHSHEMIGVGQSWVDSLAGKQFDTVYQNTTAKPIQLFIEAIISAVGSGTLTFKVGSSTPPSITLLRYEYSGTTSNKTFLISPIIPPGHFYTLENTEGDALIITWGELK